MKTYQAPRYLLKITPEMKTVFEKAMAVQRADLLKGKLAVRWSQARCGYVIWSGRSSVLGLETFISESAAKVWLLETHNLLIK